MSFIRSLAILAAFGRLAPAQLPLDSQLAAEIAKIRAIDNHAHPVRPALGNDKDTDYHAMPVETLEPSTDPVRTREETLLMFDAWHQLFGYRYSDRTPEQVRELQQRKKQLMQEKGAGYANWCSTGWNRHHVGQSRRHGPVAPPRFLSVTFEDALMYPLNNSSLAAKNSDRKAFFADEGRLLLRYLKESGYSEPPASFDEYLNCHARAT